MWNKAIKNLCYSYISENHKNELSLVPIKDLRFGTSLTGILPYGILSIREDELDKKGIMFVKVHPDTAKGLGLKDKCLVKVKGKNGQLVAKVSIDPNIVPKSVGVIMGLGRYGWDEFNRKKGENISKLFSLDREDGLNRYRWSFAKIELKRLKA